MGSKRKAASQEPKSEEFVESDSDTVKEEPSSGEEDKLPKPKQRAKKVKAEREAEPDAGPSGGSAAPAAWAKDADGRPYKKLSEKSMKRVTISTFKGKTFVDIREYYTDKNSGQEKPGKKGIALQMEDWKTLKGMMGEIDEQLK